MFGEREERLQMLERGIAALEAAEANDRAALIALQRQTAALQRLTRAGALQEEADRQRRLAGQLDALWAYDGIEQRAGAEKH